MAKLNFPTGADAIRASAASMKGGGKFARNMFWKNGEKKYVQFITPLNEVPTVQHYNVCVGATSDGTVIMRDFIDPRPYLGYDAYNPIAERWESKGVRAKPKQAVVAVELERVRSGGKNVFTVKTHSYENKNGEMVDAPNVGVIIQSPFFFSPLATHFDEIGPIEDNVFLIERVKDASPVKYNIMSVGGAIELDEKVIDAVDLEGYLDGLMSEDRYHEFIDHLDDDHVLDKFAQNKKDKSSKPVMASVKTYDEEDGASAFSDLKARLKKDS